jgi:oligosaccharide repeat unit polymerase
MRFLSNPNFIYIGTFSVPFLVYNLGWSTLYPNISNELIIFYITTFSICLVCGYILQKVAPFKYQPIPEFRYNKFVIAFIFLFFIVDCAYMGFIPLIYFSSGGDYTGSDFSFGIPTVHVIMVTFSLFFSLYVFHQYISNKRKQLLWLFLLTIVPFVILMQRSNIMYIIIGAVFIFTLSQKSIKLKRIIQLVVVALFSIFIFGYLGNLRSAKGDSTYIPKVSGVTDEFLNGPVPNEFYWGYLYVGSPLGNLQNNINHEQNVKPDLKSLVVYEFIPDFLSKKIIELLSPQRRDFHQLNSFLNVGTIYANSFSYLSWEGLMLMFVYLMFIINIYYILIAKSSMFRITGLALLFNLIAFANFSNTIQYSAFSIQLLYPLLCPILFSGKYKINKAQITQVSTS